jgi:putative hydrolase of the HAD superfamily
VKEVAQPGGNGSLGTPLRTVTFDFWNTLMWEEPGSLKARRLEVWSEELAAAGAEVEPAELESAHDAAHGSYVEAWEAGRQFVVDDAAEMILSRLDRSLPPDARDLLLQGFDEAGRRAAIHPSHGVAQCLRDLKAAGISLGIVCDIGLTPSPVVRSLLGQHGLLELFDDTTFSDEVGHYKPDPAIFRHALAELGTVEPHAAAHVGDRRRTDVAGAQAFGMTAIRYNGVYEDEASAPEAHIVTDDLGRLPRILGIVEQGA